ncbi:hypothetical protein OAM69_01665 [bacterium]|nr:hypothetical protein [bacterium]
MIKNKQRKSTLATRAITILTLTTAFSTIANAEDFDVSGVIESKNSHNVQAISDNYIILLASMEETLVPKDPKSPWKGATGPCGGAVEIKAGKIEGDGFCSFTDTENDKFVISWTAQSMNEKGGPIGVWELTAGTGKYANASASGEYNDLPSEDPKWSTITIIGQLTIP